MSEIQIWLNHLGVAIVVFLSVNWLGKHSTMFGYDTMAGLTDTESTSVYNIFFRISAPLVILLVISAILYQLKLDKWVTNIHHAIPLYIAIRLTFNIARGRLLLVPWTKFLVQAILLIWLSSLAYKNLISKRDFLMPNAATIGNELWLAIGIYLYTLTTRIELGRKGPVRRKHNYFKSKTSHYKKKYAALIAQPSPQQGFEALVYSVMLYEDFNRPLLARALERIAFKFGKARTLGIMQVTTDHSISDEESVRIGTQELWRCYQETLANTDDWQTSDAFRSERTVREIRDREDSNIAHRTLVKYNPSGDYAREVQYIRDELISIVFKENTASLHPDDN